MSAVPRRRASALAICGLALAAAGALILPDARAEPPSASDDPATLRTAYAGPPPTWPAPFIDPDVAFVELGRSPGRTSPPDEAMAALGARLFSDARLSADGSIACASCHDPAHGFSVATPVAYGMGGVPGRRNPPALFTVATRTAFDWDGGEHDLSARVLAPLTKADEMGNGNLEVVLARVAASQEGPAFHRNFGAEGVSMRTLAAALSAYLATLDTPTRFDRFASGETSALSDTELSGLHLFRTKARCANCHFGPSLEDGRFHNLKLSFFGEKAQDLGRHAITGDPDDAGRFRTPSLRHIASSAPYMHNGLFPTLEGVINLYDRGGGEVWARNAKETARPLYREAARLSPHIRPLGLTPEEKAALAAFLRAL